MDSFKANKILQDFKKESIEKKYDISFMSDFPPEADIDGMMHQYGGRHYVLREDKEGDFVYGNFYEPGYKFLVKVTDDHICFFKESYKERQPKFLYYKKLK